MNDFAATGPSAPAGFEALFAEFLQEAFDLPPAATQVGRVPLEDWPAETARLVAAAGQGYWRRRQAREARLAAALAATAPLVTPASLRLFASERITVEPMPNPAAPEAGDSCYIKINHGFWEQLYAVFAPPDPARMRVTDPERFREQYVRSGFLDALAVALGRVARVDDHQVEFPGIDLAVSLASGTHDHPDVLAKFAARSPAEQKIVMGAAIGLNAWWETLFPDRRTAFRDGSFPKRGLVTGRLAETLAATAGTSARIVFVVPPHLAGLRLLGTAIPQETVPVPAATVHESWPACLEATARHVLGRLAEEGSLLVITQSAVFSAVLGCFLMAAKRRLLPPASRLAYFDLGQALDVAAPAAGGLWSRRHAVGGSDLFGIDRS
jgi:hypothetical protein